MAFGRKLLRCVRVVCNPPLLISSGARAPSQASAATRRRRAAPRPTPATSTHSFSRSCLCVARARPRDLCALSPAGCRLHPAHPPLDARHYLSADGVGAGLLISPMFISEIAPPRYRGSLVTLSEVSLSFGVLLAYVVNVLLSGLPDQWRWMLRLGALPGVLLTLRILFLPGECMHTHTGSRIHAHRTCPMADACLPSSRPTEPSPSAACRQSRHDSSSPRDTWPTLGVCCGPSCTRRHQRRQGALRPLPSQ